MSRQRRSQEQAIHDALVYPGTEVWRNKLGISDMAELEAAEAHIMAVRSLTRPTFKAFTLKEMQALHKHLLSDLYEWAGKLRQYTTGRSAASFARPEYIESYFASAVAQPLQREGYLRGLAREDFAARAAHFVNEANAVHPFADGNGRATRFFLADLAQQAGWPFSIARVEADKGAWYAAAKQGFEHDDTSLFTRCILRGMDGNWAA